MRRAIPLVLAAGLVALTACRTPSPAPPRAPESQAARSSAQHSTGTLEARVTAYWNARRGKNLAAMYEFYSSEYRAKVSRAEFLTLTRLVRFDIAGVHVDEIQATGDRADVALTLKLIVPTIAREPLDSHVKDVWVRERDGIWYKLDEPLLLPFPKSALDEMGAR